MIFVISNKKLKNINDIDLNGISHLDCSYNYLFNIDSINSVTSLITLIVYKNFLTTLPCLEKLINLRELDCSNNKLKILPSLEKNIYLNIFNCSYNYIKKLPDLPKSLIKIYCDNNFISEILYVPHNVIYFNCSYNNLNTLNFNMPTNIEYLDCSYNIIDELPSMDYIQSSLIFICSNNFIKKLPKFNKINKLDCSYNKIEKISLYPLFIKKIYFIDCSYNNLIYFDFSTFCLEINEKIFVNISNNNLPLILKLEKFYEFFNLMQFIKIHNNNSGFKVYNINNDLYLSEINNIKIINNKIKKFRMLYYSLKFKKKLLIKKKYNIYCIYIYI